jgi:hypothetical protein
MTTVETTEPVGRRSEDRYAKGSGARKGTVLKECLQEERKKWRRLITSRCSIKE